MPGKNDKKKTKLGHIQKRVLNDNLMFLHLKFKAETSRKISFATFCCLRPVHISLTKYISRNKCLCQKHQNMALALKNMKTAGANITLNPDEFIRKLNDINPQDIISEIKDDKIMYEQWKKVDMADGKKRTKIVQIELSNAEFVSAVLVQVCEFQQHVSRVRIQYKALTNLKENLPAGNAIVQMDFAENFSSCSADEVQSAYWNSSSVTLHPVVVYYKDGDDKMAHTNYVFVSDDLGQNIGTVYTILQKLIPKIKQNINDLKKIHYWTDSPSSQYRNKTAFYLVSDHQNLFGVDATWNYFETGHGKGPCDRIGGTSKRIADQAIKQGKIVVQDAREYYEHVQVHHTSATYVFVESTDCVKSRLELTEINKTLKPVQGTMQIHSVVGVATGEIKTCITSCYCNDCLQGNFHDMTVANVMKSQIRNVPVDIPVDEQIEHENETVGVVEYVDESERVGEINETENDEEERNNEENRRLNVKSGQYAAVQYEKKWHVGKVIEVDENDNEYLVTFMRPSQGKNTGHSLYVWPSNEDELWVKRDDILCEIHEPVKVGRSGRSYAICQEDIELASRLVKATLPNS
ncbi:uncharacterized protein LOC127724675 [Mytilus californianus]|uniref:uncharacterized protein LOC127724675 n=1 Tax=Mytilus californianus TaxID=6549 RepID=UPI0022460657|nr:uncharacterized protein LOC127724675 [Mytilus californianus]